MKLFHLCNADEEIGDQLEAVKAALGKRKWTHQPIGPLGDYVDSPQAKDRIPSEALSTLIVFSFQDLEAAREILQNAELPVPSFGVVRYDPDENFTPDYLQWKSTGRRHWRACLLLLRTTSLINTRLKVSTHNVGTLSARQQEPHTY